METNNIKLFETTTFVFAQINPMKKYAQFSYYDATFEMVNIGDCDKEIILKIDNEYYQYSKSLVNHLSVKIPSTIIFKKGNKVIKEKSAY